MAHFKQCKTRTIKFQPHLKIMESIEKSIDVNVPVRVAYDQWTQFEEFPRFMEGVKEVRQLGDKRLHWRAEVGGREKEWEAEIFEQTPDERIAWRSMSGAKNSGMVNFAPLGPTQCRLYLRLNYDPEGATESIGDFLGIVKARVAGDLNRFKEFIEERQTATGSWRGEIQGKQVLSSTTPGNKSGVL
jgi:uncharacterized membrane protein